MPRSLFARHDFPGDALGGFGFRNPQDPVERSRRLLVENLTPEQGIDFERHGYFKVESQGEEYEVRDNITVRVRDGARFCVVYPGLPVYDQMLARKLDLEHRPEMFFKIANLMGRSLNLAGSERGTMGHLLLRAIYSECARRQMDPRLIQMRISDNPWDRAIMGWTINVSYADAEAALTLDREHALRANFADVIETTAQKLVEHLNRIIDSRVEEAMMGRAKP